MQAEIIKIGNSRGLRIPRAILEQCGMETTVTLRVEDHSLIITPLENPRAGWAESFKLMAQNGDDVLLDPDLFSLESDDEEWQW